MTRPALALYCQHSLGLGHLVRSWTLADALSARFDVTLWCGGPLPADLPPPATFDVVALPPMAQDSGGGLISLDARYAAQRALELRRDLMLHHLAARRPAVVVVELFPFGRKKFGAELVPLLEAARSMSPRPLVACSVRDILVARGEDQGEHDERARSLLEQFFDVVVAHTDPAFARLDEFFHPSRPLRTPVHYTGFVAGRPLPARASRRSGIIVSAGGGRFAGALFTAAIEAHQLLPEAIELTIVAGPLCEGSTVERLVAASRCYPSIRVHRTVTDLSAAMAAARLSISQCGYNTVLDLVRARVPALVVPFAERGETEQTDRARRLEAMGVVRVLPPERLDPTTLAGAIEKTMEWQPAAFTLDLDGAKETTRILTALVTEPRPAADRSVTVHEHLA